MHLTPTTTTTRQQPGYVGAIYLELVQQQVVFKGQFGDACGGQGLDKERGTRSACMHGKYWHTVVETDLFLLPRNNLLVY